MSQNKPIRKLVIPAAGVGTRGLPYTKEVPKEFLPILDIPAIHWIVEEGIDSGIEQIIFVTARGKQVLEDYFDYATGLEALLKARGKDELAERVHKIGSLCEVIAVRQKEAKGLGHAVLCAQPAVGDEPFAVCLGDEVFTPWGKPQGASRGVGSLCAAYNKSQISVAGVMEVPKADSVLYGMVDVMGKDLGAKTPEASRPSAPVSKAIEKPTPENSPSQYAIIGRYAFSPEIFPILKETPAGKGGEIQLTDAMNALATQGKLQAMLLDGPRYDLGSPLQFVMAQVDCALQRPEWRERLKEQLRSRL